MTTWAHIAFLFHFWLGVLTGHPMNIIPGVETARRPEGPLVYQLMMGPLHYRQQLGAYSEKAACEAAAKENNLKFADDNENWEASCFPSRDNSSDRHLWRVFFVDNHGHWNDAEDAYYSRKECEKKVTLDRGDMAPDTTGYERCFYAGLTVATQADDKGSK